MMLCLILNASLPVNNANSSKANTLIQKISNIFKSKLSIC